MMLLDVLTVDQLQTKGVENIVQYVDYKQKTYAVLLFTGCGEYELSITQVEFNSATGDVTPLSETYDTTLLGEDGNLQLAYKYLTVNFEGITNQLIAK